MKTTVLYAGLASPHAGWAAIDEFAELIGRYFKAEILSPAELDASWPLPLLNRKKRYEPIISSGGDTLIVVARNPGDLAMVNSIRECRKRFGKIYGIVTDSYFREGFLDETSIYDAITVTAHEDVAYPEERFCIPVHQMYQGADCLNWAPRMFRSREIDLMGFGRIPASYHDSFARRYHNPDSPYLYLHSPLGNLTGNSVHLERGMLFKLLHRTRISLAFHLFVEPAGNRPRSMMVTSRWLESLLSGCIVAGRKPVSRMAIDMLSWPGATTELSEEPEIAADQLRVMLADNDHLEEQRIINISEMITRHDWRHRIVEFCRLTALPVPAELGDDLERLEQLGASYTCAV
jgi:hypothetical protein